MMKKAHLILSALFLMCQHWFGCLMHLSNFHRYILKGLFPFKSMSSSLRQEVEQI